MPLVPTPGRETLPLPRAEDLNLVLRYTRHWIHYGLLTHIGVCVLVAAAKGLLGG